MGPPDRSRHWRAEHDTRAARLTRHERELRSAYRSTAWSTVFPGGGLFRFNSLLAYAIVLTFLIPLAWVAYRIATEGALNSVLKLGVSASQLQVARIGLLVVAGVWILGILATAWLARPTRPVRSDSVALSVFAAAMSVIIAAPTALAVQWLGIQRSTVSEVVTASTRDRTTAEGKDPWAGISRVNLLLLGSDEGPDREGVRPDSIMVASMEPESGNTVLIGLPRNLQNVPFPTRNPLHEEFPEGYNCGSECLLNAVWTLADQRPDLFPGESNPGLKTTRDVVSEITGLKIDDTVVVDLDGFEQLVDAMGGVTINALERVPIGGKVRNGQVVGINGWIEAGEQHMDGYHALWYARSRATTDDFSRMRRQRCVVGAIVDQVNPLRMLANYPELADAVADNVSVDIPADDLGAWAELVLRMQDARITSLPITNTIVHTANPDYPLIRQLVREAIVESTRPAPPSPTATPTPTESPDTLEPTDPPTDGATDDATDGATDGETEQPDDSVTDLSEAC